MKLTGWGRFPIIQARGRSFDHQEALGDYLKSAEGCIAHGMGRSYGNSALNEQVILTRRFNKILSFDPQIGIVVCESGVSLAELIDAFLPRGWFPGVVPGTKFISLGGAIASDVHGKNHHQMGCFSEFVSAFDLMLPQGEVVRCSRQENAPLFHATCGGMGLTGVILTAALRLQPAQSSYIRETLIPGPNLEEVIRLFEENQAAAHSVAWIDCLAKNEHQGRSIVMLGEPAEAGPLNLPPSKTWTVPVGLPGFCLNQYSVSLFNYFYYQFKSNFVAAAWSPWMSFSSPWTKSPTGTSYTAAGGSPNISWCCPRMPAWRDSRLFWPRSPRPAWAPSWRSLALRAGKRQLPLLPPGRLYSGVGFQDSKPALYFSG